jgi:PHAX RNA-binding domain
MSNNEPLPTPEQDSTEPSQAETAAMIADALGETAFGPRATITSLVRTLGRTQARALLTKTQEIEEHEGLMLPDGSRRRTPGGVFFHLAYTTGQPKHGKTLVRPQKPQRKPKHGDAQPVQDHATQKARSATEKSEPAIVVTWDDRVAIIKEAETEKGNASTVKITLVGRPGKVLDKGAFIVTVMESTKVPMLPKGLPTPGSMTTKYCVYVAAKQWKKVAEAIVDPEDTLIIEGFPKTDAETSAIAVFTTNITTKKQQMAKRQDKPE